MSNPFVVIHSDRSILYLETAPTNGGDPLVVLSGSFKGSPDERRTCTVFLTNGFGIAELRMEFTDPAFVENTVLGQQIYAGQEPDIQSLNQGDT